MWLFWSNLSKIRKIITEKKKRIVWEFIERLSSVNVRKYNYLERGPTHQRPSCFIYSHWYTSFISLTVWFSTSWISPQLLWVCHLQLGRSRRKAYNLDLQRDHRSDPNQWSRPDFVRLSWPWIRPFVCLALERCECRARWYFSSLQLRCLQGWGSRKGRLAGREEGSTSGCNPLRRREGSRRLCHRQGDYAHPSPRWCLRSLAL